MPTAVTLVSAQPPLREEASNTVTVEHPSLSLASPLPSPSHATASSSASTAVASSSVNHSSMMASQKQQQLTFIQQQQYLQQHQQRQVVFAQRQRQQHQQQYHPSSVKHNQSNSIGPVLPCPGQGQQYPGQTSQQPRHPHPLEQMDPKPQQKLHPHQQQAPGEVEKGPTMDSAASLATLFKEGEIASQDQQVSRRSETTNRQTVDLVDDAWRMIFYMLASSCRDLGRTMQVSRRFHNLIANDATLWKLTYKLTVSGSIFSSQKSLLNSPSTSSKPTELLSRNQQPINKGASTDLSEECWSSRTNPPSSPADHSAGVGPSYPERNQYRTSKGRNNSDSENLPLSTWKDSLDEPSTSSTSPSARRHSAPLQPSPIPPQQQQPHPPQPTRSNSVGDIYDHWSGGIGLSPALQIPSALVLPHHRRLAQAALSHNSNNIPSVPVVDRSLDISAIQQQQGVGLGHTSTPASTPVTSSASSFPTTLPAMVSQVQSNSTIPLSSIVYPHHIPTTTLMHHPPAVYWKYQVVEWLEQEKLRCLRLGLFWGFNADSSRSHSRKARRNPAPLLS